MAHINVPEAEKIIDKEIPCLDHGFVRLVDYMGSDESIVQAARVSYGRGTKKVRQDQGLIRYLLRHNHTSPFEMVEFKFHCKMPIFVARQWIRHRTASVNEYSLRYSRAINDFYTPAPEAVRYQSKTNRQGRANDTVPVELQQLVLEILKDHADRAWADYEELEGKNIARELARIHLPVSIYTEWYWKIDLNNLLRFLQLRLDPHAQYEIRIYAEAIAKIVEKVVPLTWEAFTDYELLSQKFSRQELQIVNTVLEQLPQKTDWEKLAKTEGFGELEAKEFAAKLKIN